MDINAPCPIPRPSTPRSPYPNHGDLVKKIDFDDDYYSRLSRRISDGLKDDIDREVFTATILKQISGKEFALSGYKNPSACIQWVIENTTDLLIIRSLAVSFYPRNFDPKLLFNQHTSRVIQLLIEAALKILSNECSSGDHSTEKPTRHGEWTEQFIRAYGSYTISHMDTLLTDGNGTHLMVTIVEALGGVRIGRHWSRKTIGFALKSAINLELEKDNVIKVLPEPFGQYLKKFAKRLIVSRPDRDLIALILGQGSTLIQNFLFILYVRFHRVCQFLIKRIVTVIFSTEETKLAITTNSASAYLLEAIMLVCSADRLTKLWDRYLNGKLKEMWKDDIANFVVQRLIDAVQDLNLFRKICAEVFPELRNVFAYNRPGIGVCLAKACLRFNSMQEPFINALLIAFNCENRQLDLVPSMLFGESKHRRSLWLHGSLMLQYIFRFENPYKVSKSLLSLDPRRLFDVYSDKSGSHVIDCFLKSENVPEKYKAQFNEKIKSHTQTSVRSPRSRTNGTNSGSHRRSRSRDRSRSPHPKRIPSSNQTTAVRRRNKIQTENWSW